MPALRVVAELMEIAAVTAPKAAGRDFIVVRTVEGDELRRLGQGMIDYGKRTGKPNFDRDGQNVLGSGAVVLIGLKDADVVDLNCACVPEACIVPNTFDGEFGARTARCATRPGIAWLGGQDGSDVTSTTGSCTAPA
jgi:uncharacterized ferredoxin-like protein